MMKYEDLYEKYKLYDEEQLKNIIADDEHTELAKQVASDLLKSDRKEFHKMQADKIQHEQAVKRKREQQKYNPLYDDIHQIAGDLRFIKNLIIVGLVLGVLLSVIAGINLL